MFSSGFPLVWPVRLVSRLFTSLFGGPAASNPYWTLDELAELSERIGASDLGSPSQELLRSIIDASPDLIINGSSAGLTGQFSAPNLITHKDQVYYDLNYSLEATPFCEWAKAISPNVYDGIGMLVNQAAYSFNYWFGVKPNTDKVLSDLKSL